MDRSPPLLRNWPNPQYLVPRLATGYLPGAPKLAEGGLSTFTVDNSSGDGDATVRLYLGGKKPAVRTFHVRKGEKFIAQSMSPGPYRMRYRLAASDDTYEANETFMVRETETDTVRRYSQITVTLYKVIAGNLRTSKVSKEDF